MSNLLTKTKNKTAKRVGRGGTRGKTSGRGTKGQKARSGHRIRPHIRDAIKKLPKLRGRGKNSNKGFRIKAVAVNVSMLEQAFAANTRITPGVLFEKGIVSREKGILPQVKILANGDLSKPFTFKGCTISEAAKKKIVAAGGTVS